MQVCGAGGAFLGIWGLKVTEKELGDMYVKDIGGSGVVCIFPGEFYLSFIILCLSLCSFLLQMFYMEVFYSLIFVPPRFF